MTALFDADLERTIVGASLQKPAMMQSVFKSVDHDDFQIEENRRSWRAMREASDDGDQITAHTIARKLATNGDIAKWEARLADIEFGAVAEGLTKKTVDELKRFTKKRKLAALAESISTALDADEDTDTIAAAADAVTSGFREPAQEPAAAAAIRVDMPDTVLDGRLGEIVQRRLAGLPLAYSWGATVTIAGTMLDRVDAPIRTNLYWAAVGPTDSGKSVSMEYACRVLGMAHGPRLLRDSKFGSAEGLAQALAEIEPNAVRLLAPDELSHLLSKAAIDRSSFPFILNTAYYQDRQEGGTKGKLFKIDCRLSLMGGLVEDQFGDSFGAATVGGLHDRFIFGLCPQPSQYLYRPFEGRPEALNPFHLSVNSDVWELRDSWVQTEGIRPRVTEHALRVAYICAAFDGRPELRAADLDPALAFARYQMRARIVLAPNPGENADAKCAVLVRNWLHEHVPNGAWASRRDVDRGTHASQRYGPMIFNRTLKGLAFNSEIDLGPGEKRMRLVQPW